MPTIKRGATVRRTGRWALGGGRRARVADWMLRVARTGEDGRNDDGGDDAGNDDGIGVDRLLNEFFGF